VDEAGELDVGDVARGAIDSFEVPYGLCSSWVDLVKETSSVVLVEDSSKAPWMLITFYAWSAM
jgi:hypothetical protein